jgi:hypothetical protein
MKTTLTILILYSLINASGVKQTSLLTPEKLQRNKVHRIYTAELGIKETTGDNDGPRVEEYLHAVGLKKGDPWCAAFVCWVFDKAGVSNPHSGWSPDLFPKKNRIWQRSGSLTTGTRPGKQIPLPQQGDVFGIWFPEKHRIAHAGFVDHWGDTWLITVEGNTNEAGSREGDGVLRKRRMVRSVWQVANFVGYRVIVRGL